jgi:hypothetical protein
VHLPQRFSNHVERQKPEKISHQRHHDARNADRKGFDGKKDNRHGHDPQYDHRLGGSPLGVVGDFPIDHLLDIPVFFHYIDKRPGRRPYKGDQYEKANANSEPQSFIGKYSGFFPMRIHQPLLQHPITI